MRTCIIFHGNKKNLHIVQQHPIHYGMNLETNITWLEFKAENNMNSCLKLSLNHDNGCKQEHWK